MLFSLSFLAEKWLRWFPTTHYTLWRFLYGDCVCGTSHIFKGHIGICFYSSMCSRSMFLLNVCLFNPKHIIKLMRWHFLRFKIDQFPNWTWFKVTHRRVNVLRRIVSENVFVHCIPIYNGFCFHTCWFQIQTSIEPYQSNYRLVWQMKKRFFPRLSSCASNHFWMWSFLCVCAPNNVFRLFGDSTFFLFFF